jgi:membrane protease YdiL (CAAX protease family)
LTPAAIGVVGGLVDFALGASVAGACYVSGLSTVRTGLGILSFHVPHPAWIPWIENCIAPLVEEIFFRGMIQEGLKDLACRVSPQLPHSANKMIAIVVTAILFGLAHYLSAASALQVVVCTVSGVVLGVIKEKQGLVASTSAHVVSNLLNS